MARVERCGEQYGAARSGQPRADETRGNDVAQAEARQNALAARLATGDVENEMFIEQLGDARKADGFQIETLQRAIHCLRVLVEMIADGRDALVEVADEFSGAAEYA